jgi:ribosomal subunit interface protein
MSLRVSGKNLDIGETLRMQAHERVGEALAKYVSGGYSGHVTVEKDGLGFRTECTLHLDSGVTMHVEGSAGDAYQSLGRAVERIAKQLRRYKRRRVDIEPGPAPDAAEPAPRDEAESDDGVASAAIIAEGVESLPSLSTALAVARIEQGVAEQIVYRNPGTRRVNLVRRRADGHIGWVDLGGSGANGAA